MISRYHIICFLLILFFAVAGCSRLDSEKPTPTSLATLEIAAETRVPSPTTAATLTPPPTTTRTDIPSPVPTSTELPSPTSPPQPTLTPHPTVTFQNDRWQQIEISPEISGGLDNNWLAFINYNDRARALSTAATPEPASLEQTLYLVNPVNHRRVEVADIPVSAGNRVYWSPAGNHAAYFVQPDFDENGEQIGGLYMLDLEVGLQYRLFDIPNLNPRGIAGNEPAWSADGSRLAVVLPTEYATDIFIMNADGTNFRNLTNSGSYELWHAFSPDGLWLAFVSDRDTCPTWTPDEPGSCAQPDAAPPTQGKLYIMNLNTGEVRKITDVLLNGAPEWITPTELS
ncbi:MAG TPA: hypothetical protein VJZ27_03120, partial [Aggregatilineales bacterium]|nr:hypothetical protein [Aggregatilineales bacterium]